MKNWLTFSILVIICNTASAQIGWMATFESISLAKPDTFWNGSDLSASLKSGKATFKNNYDTAWKVWNGFGVSNVKDSITANYSNQYAVRSASGVNFTKNYAVVSQRATVVLDQSQIVNGCYINNATYTARSMETGDGFAKQFGGISGNDADYFRVIATGYLGVDSTQEVFYLADFRNSDNSKDYIVTDWVHWNLERLGDVDSIVFNMESSDTGQFGMNTPAFFCIDNFNSDSLSNTYDIAEFNFEQTIGANTYENGANYDGGFVINQTLFANDYNADWNAWTGWSISTTTDTSDGSYANQYSSKTGTGENQSKTYLTGFSRASILFPYVEKPHFTPLAYRNFRVSVNNSTYGYKTMANGNAFAKKFGGNTGNDKDYFVLKISGVDFYGKPTDTITHFLADYRFDDNTKDYIQRDWTQIWLSSIFENTTVIRVDFWIEGSDTGQFGLNTPAYFCIDELLPFTGSVRQTMVEQVTLYPNPVSDLLHFTYNKPFTSVSVADLHGKLQQVSLVDTNTLDPTLLTPGIYIIKLETAEGLVTKQFIKI